MLFMHRMSQAVQMQTGAALFQPDADDMTAEISSKHAGMREFLPAGVDVFQVRGPLFFGVAARLIDALEQAQTPPKVFILRLGDVPMMDSSGALALYEFIARCQKQKTHVIVEGLSAAIADIFTRLKPPHGGDISYMTAAGFSDALEKAKDILNG